MKRLIKADKGHKVTFEDVKRQLENHTDLDVKSKDVEAYIYSVVDYINHAKSTDPSYSVADWFKDTKDNYPDDWKDLTKIKSTNSSRRVVKSSREYKFSVGDTVKYDSNFRGVNPKYGVGKIVSIKPGLAGRGDSNPNPIYTIETKSGKTFKLDEPGILKVAKSSEITESKRITASKAYENPKYQKALDEYMPESGEGSSMANQIATAVNRLVYKWYNDGDVYDNTHYMDGWANDLSDEANWLSTKPWGCYAILKRITNCTSESEYEQILSDLVDHALDLEYLESFADRPRNGSIYDCDGPFHWQEPGYEDEQEDEYDEYEDDDEDAWDRRYDY